MLLRRRRWQFQQTANSKHVKVLRPKMSRTGWELRNFIAIAKNKSLLFLRAISAIIFIFYSIFKHTAQQHNNLPSRAKKNIAKVQNDDRPRAYTTYRNFCTIFSLSLVSLFFACCSIQQVLESLRRFAEIAVYNVGGIEHKSIHNVRTEMKERNEQFDTERIHLCKSLRLCECVHQHKLTLIHEIPRAKRFSLKIYIHLSVVVEVPSKSDLHVRAC